VLQGYRIAFKIAKDFLETVFDFGGLKLITARMTIQAMDIP
jgi:hypothetical protein